MNQRRIAYMLEQIWKQNKNINLGDLKKYKTVAKAYFVICM